MHNAITIRSYIAVESMTSVSLVTPSYTNKDINKQLIEFQSIMLLLLHNTLRILTDQVTLFVTSQSLNHLSVQFILCLITSQNIHVQINFWIVEIINK